MGKRMAKLDKKKLKVEEDVKDLKLLLYRYLKGNVTNGLIPGLENLTER